MYVLVMNAGSSSLKVQLVDMPDKRIVAKARCERIGIGIDGQVTLSIEGKETVTEIKLISISSALDFVIHELQYTEHPIIEKASDIIACGHRLVTGFEKYHGSVKIDAEVLHIVEQSALLAPLHVPAMLEAIERCTQLFPSAVQVAVFDSSFHHTLAEKAYIYALPYEYYQKYGFRKYAYHGTSGRYVSAKYAASSGHSLIGQKIIVCHLGNGSTVMAINDGKSVDASTGYGTSDGIMMGSRSGSVDTAVLLYAAAREKLTVEEMDTVIYKKSGLLGVSGVSNDLQEVIKAAKAGNHRAQLAMEMLAFQVKKHIGAYAAEMNGIDALIFTAGIGENASAIRADVCKEMDFLGIRLDEKLNEEFNHRLGKISSADSRCEVWIIPTDEEEIIAQDAYEIATRVNEKLPKPTQFSLF